MKVFSQIKMSYKTLQSFKKFNPNYDYNLNKFFMGK